MTSRTTWRASRRTLAVLALAGMSVTACGGDDDGGASAADEPADEPGAEPADEAAIDDEADDEATDGDPEPAGDSTSCSLVTADDVASLGYEVDGDPEPNTLAPTDECRVPVVDSRGIDSAVAVVVYTESEAVALGPDLYPDNELVDGVGEAAWYNGNLHLAQARLADGRVVSIQDVGGDATRAGLVGLLTTAVERAG